MNFPAKLVAGQPFLAPLIHVCNAPSAMESVKTKSRRGKHPNSQANLRRGAQPPIRRPERAPETLPAVGAAVDSAVQAVARVEPVASAVEMFKEAAPAAAATLIRLATGSLRAAPHVRSAAAVKVLEGAGVPFAQGAQAVPGKPPEHLAAALAVLSRALELKQRAAVASDAEVIPAK